MSWAELLVIVWWVREQHPGDGNSNEEDLDQAVKVVLLASIWVDFHCWLGPFVQGVDPEIWQGDYRPEESILKSYKVGTAEDSNEDSLEGEQ